MDSYYAAMWVQVISSTPSSLYKEKPAETTKHLILKLQVDLLWRLFPTLTIMGSIVDV